MLYGFFPLFIFGFLFTTYPAWPSAPKIPRRRYISVFLLMASGHLIFYAGLAVSSMLAALGVLLVLLGWGAALEVLVRTLWQASHPDKRHAYVTTAAPTAGWLGVAAFGVGFATAEPRWLAFATTVDV